MFQSKSMCKQILILSILFLFTIQNSAHADLRNGLVGWWKLDEASGNAIDSSSSGNTGTPNGTTIVSNCKRGGCRSFNGTTDRVAMSRVLTAVPYSISAWVKPTTCGNNSTGNGIFYQGTASNDLGTHVLVLNLVGVQNTIEFKNEGGTAFITSADAITLNVWNHVVCTIDAAGAATIYVNGINKGSGNAGTTAPSNNSAYVGTWYNSGTASRYLNGQIDDVRVYNRELSAQEVGDLYRPGILLRRGVLKQGKFNI